MRNIIVIFVGFLVGILGSRTASLIAQFLTKANLPDFLINILCVLIFLTIVILPVSLITRFRISKILSEQLQFSPVDFHHFSDLDIDELASCTCSLESLGFNCLGDYQLTYASAQSMIRVFAHPCCYCFAEVSQTFSPRRSLPMHCVIESHFEQNWSLSHRHHKMSRVLGGTAYMMRQKRHLWANHSNASPEELLRIHLECRQQIVADLGLRVLTDMSVKAFNSYMQDYCRTRYQVMKEKSLFIGLVEAFLFSLRPKTEWMGEYATKRKN